MAYTGAGVVSYGFPIDQFIFTYLISGLADQAATDAAPGKVVSFDNSAASTVKLAADGDTIVGRVKTSENRDVLGIKVAAVQRKFKERVAAVANHGLAVGDTVLGGGGGLVKKNGTGTPTNSRVVEVFNDNTVSIEHF